MEKLTLNLPTMYGDHHVIEVRRILLETPGITEVYASSCFQIVEVDYDPAQLDGEVVAGRLEKAGYYRELSTPVESDTAAYGRSSDSDVFFRHTIAYEQTNEVVGFSQKVNAAERPLWPCPGMGVIERKMEE
jgi:copper chaperone CopZ